MKLNDVIIRSLAPPERGQRSYPDDALPGFAVRVSQGGTRTFILVHGRSRTRTTIGRYPIISLAQARSRAKEILAEITLGTHRPKSLSFAEALDLYIEHQLKRKNRPNTAVESERLLRRALPRLGKSALSSIQTSEIAAFLDRLCDTPSEANHLYVALKTFFNVCIDRGYIEASPIGRLKKPHRERRRRRVLTPEELRSVLVTAQDFGTYGRLLRLLIYSGQRLAQVQTLTHRHIDQEARTLTWSAEEMKSDEPHIVPYHDLTAELLEHSAAHGWLFPGEEDPTKHFNNLADPHAALLKASGVAHFTRHDLRRVYSTFHAREIGTAPHVVDRILAHKTGTTEGDSEISRIYNVYRYQREFREAAIAWERYLSELVARS